MTAAESNALTLRLLTADELSTELRDELALTRRELALYRLMVKAALDQLALVATRAEHYENIQRILRKDREQFMAGALLGETRQGETIE
mgnify:CR=1